MPRPTKLTDEVEQKILKAIRAGNFREIAAQYAGVDPGTFYRWMDRGRKALHVLEDLEAMPTAALSKLVKSRQIIEYPVYDDEEDPTLETTMKRLPKRPKKGQLVLALWRAECRFMRFRESVTRATAEAEVGVVGRLRKLGEDGDSKALMFYLERAHSDRWGRRDRLALENVPDEALEAEARRLREEIAAARAEAGLSESEDDYVD